MVMRVSTEFVEDDDRANLPEMFGWAFEEAPPPEEPLDLTPEQLSIEAQRRVLEKGEQLL